MYGFQGMCNLTPPLTLTPPLAQDGHEPHISHEVMLLSLPEPLYFKDALACQNAATTLRRSKG